MEFCLIIYVHNVTFNETNHFGILRLFLNQNYQFFEKMCGKHVIQHESRFISWPNKIFAELYMPFPILCIDNPYHTDIRQLPWQLRQYPELAGSKYLGA